MKLFFAILICALPILSKAQITSIGLTTGVNGYFNSPYTFQVNSYTIKLDEGSVGYLNFGTFIEHSVLAKYGLSHKINLHSFYPSYSIFGSPTTSLGRANGSTFTISYNGMVRLYSKMGLRLMTGFGIDINLPNRTTPDFSDEELNQIINQLQQTFTPLVFYIGGELGYRAGRIDISLTYNHSLSSPTSSMVYQGENYAIPTRQAFLFLNIGFLIFDKSLRDAKKK